MKYAQVLFSGMTVKRIVANLKSSSPDKLARFYRTLFGLETAMDFGWIVTLCENDTTRPLLSIASEGGNGAPLPDISIEVDNIDEVYESAKGMGAKIALDLTVEDWGVKRFFLVDPDGHVVNILAHQTPSS